MAKDVVRVQVEGVKELLKELERLDTDVTKVKKKALESGAEVIRDAANSRAPGPNVAHGYTRKKGMGGIEQARQGAIFIGPDDEHWYYRFFEFGAGAHDVGAASQILTPYGEEFVTGAVPHPGMPAKPFLRPALDERIFGLDELPAAFEHMRDGRHFGKIAVEI